MPGSHPKKKGHNAFFAPLYSGADTSGDLDDSPPSSRQPTTDADDHRYQSAIPNLPRAESYDSFGDPAELASFSDSPKRTARKHSAKMEVSSDSRSEGVNGLVRALSSMGAPIVRGVSQSAVRAMSTLGRSMSLLGEHLVDITGPFVDGGIFDDWSRAEILHVLVEDNVEIRDAKIVPLNVLREEADLFYTDKPIPIRPRQEDLVGADGIRAVHAAEKIQNQWVRMNSSKRLSAAAGPSASPVFRRAESASERIPEPSDPISDETMRRGFIETANSYIYAEEVEEQLPSDVNGKPMRVFALNEPWLPPSIEFSKEFANKNHPRQKVRNHKGVVESRKYSVLRTTTGRFCSLGGMGEQCDLWEEGQASELGQFGPGVTVYFKFVKYCFWCFVSLGFLYAIPLIGNSYGGYYANTDAVTDLALGTLGNLGGFVGNNTVFAMKVDNCDIDWRGEECEISRSNTAMLYSSITFSGVIVLLIGYAWLRLFEAREAIILDKNMVEASDYSVKVNNLPSHCTEAELRAHFVKVLDDHGEPQAVEDCTIAYDNEHEIEVYKQRGDLVKQRYRATQEYRYYKTLQITKEAIVTDQQLEAIASLRQKLTADIHKLDESLKEYEKDRGRHKRKPLCAYLTFQNTLGAQMALRLYGKSWLGYAFMRHKLRFKGQRLVVTRAPEPSTIIWENLRYTYKQRWSRRMGTAVISVLLLAISAIASYAPRAIGEIADNAGGNDPCPDGFYDMSRDEQREYVEQNDGTLYCYCDELSFYIQAKDSTCSKYFEANLYQQLILFGAAFVVLIVNALIDFSIRLCAQYEKHHSVDAMEQGIFIRMFITKFINMGVLFLFGNHITILGRLFGVSLPKKSTFSHEWFITVGINVMLVEIGNIFTIHFLKVMRFVYARYRQSEARKDPLIALTQDELNTLYLGPEFLISHRYAQVLADFTICLLFASGMPALIFIGMANFYSAYWVDKFLFLRFYRTPPRYSLQIGSLAASLIPYAICAHVVVAIWAFGISEELQTSNENEKDYQNNVAPYDTLDLKNILTQRHIIPLLALFVAISAMIVFSIIVNTVFGGLQRLIKGVFGGILSKYEYYNELDRYFSSNVQISYARAKQRGIIKGLINYNILQNPIYKDAFAVDDQFAGKHRNLTSIQKATELSYFGEDKVHSFQSDPGPLVQSHSDPRATALLGASGSHLTSDTDGDILNVNPLGEGKEVRKNKKDLTIVSRDESDKRTPVVGKSPGGKVLTHQAHSPGGSITAKSPSPHSAASPSAKGARDAKVFFPEVGTASHKTPDGSGAVTAKANKRRKSETNSSDATLTEAALLVRVSRAAEIVKADKKEKKKRHSVNARMEGASAGLSPEDMQYLASVKKSQVSPMASPRIKHSPRIDHVVGGVDGSIAVRERHAGRVERELPLENPIVAGPRIDPAVRYGDTPRGSITPRRHIDDEIVAPRRDSGRREEISRMTPRRDDEDHHQKHRPRSSTPHSRDRNAGDEVHTPRRQSERRRGEELTLTPRQSAVESLTPRGRGKEDSRPGRRASATGPSTPRDSSITPDRQPARRSSAAAPFSGHSQDSRGAAQRKSPLFFGDGYSSDEHMLVRDERKASSRPGLPIPPLNLGIAGYGTRNPSPRGEHRQIDDSKRYKLDGDSALEESSRPSSSRRR